MVYLDNNATTRIDAQAYAAMLPYFTDIYGNSHAAHRFGLAAHDAVETARGRIAALINAETSEVVFTSCGSESNAMVLRGFQKCSERRKVVALSVEHPSVLASLRRLESRGELRLKVVDVEGDGSLDVEKLRASIDDETALVAVMMAQNETGVIFPIDDVVTIAHERGALVLIDAVQAAGKIPIDVKASAIDFLSISGHKFHAPKGIGALFVRRGLELEPMWLGGGHEHGLRSGTTPVPLTVAFGIASESAIQHLDSAEITSLRDELEARVSLLHPEAVVHGKNLPRLPNTSLISFPGLYSDVIVAQLDDAGICVSGGAACDSGKREPSAVMKAMRISNEVGISAVRFSLSRFTTRQEINDVMETLASILHAGPR